jgi:transposase
MKKANLSKKQRGRLERQLKQTRDVRVYRRTLAVLEHDRGKSVTEIARALRVSRPSVYRWLEQYGQSRDPESLHDDQRDGRPCVWTEECSEWLESFLRRSPAELGYFAVNWTVPLLCDPLTMCLGKTFSHDTIRRALRELRYVWKRPRYVLSPDPEREKKTSNSPGNQAFAAGLRLAGRRRNRPAVVSSVAGRLEPPRRALPSADFRLQRPPRGFRRAASAYRPTAVPGPSAIIDKPTFRRFWS